MLARVGLDPQGRLFAEQDAVDGVTVESGVDAVDGIAVESGVESVESIWSLSGDGEERRRGEEVCTTRNPTYS